jgi:hypothetical protein
MQKTERWQLIDEEVVFYAPELSRDTTPDEFLETEEIQHTIMTFEKVLVGYKEFTDVATRDQWIATHPLGKRVEISNLETQIRKAGNIIEVSKGQGKDELSSAILIYIERELPPEDVGDWVI